MPNKTNYLEDEIIKHIFRTGSFTKPTNLAIGLFKTIPLDDGTGGVELAMTGYARQGLDPLDANWTATAGGDGETDNASVVSFGPLTGATERAIGVGIWDADAGGNLLYWGALANNWRGFTAADTGDQFRAVAHGLSNDDRVFLRGENLPTGPDHRTEYYIVGAAADTFQVSLTQGGAAVALTSNGWGEVGDGDARDIIANDTIRFNANGLKVAEG